MADINPMIPMSMNYGTSPFIQAADIRRSLSTADAQNLDTAKKLEEQRIHNDAQKIIKKHLKEDGTLDPVGAMKDLYAFRPETADAFAKEYSEHMANELKGLQSQGNVQAFPEAQRFQHEQWAKEGYGPLAGQQIDKQALAKEQATTANFQPPQQVMGQVPQQPVLNVSPGTPMGRLQDMLGTNPVANIQPQMPSAQPITPEASTLSQMIGQQVPAQPQTPQAQTGMPQSIIDNYREYLVSPTRESMANVINPNLATKATPMEAIKQQIAPKKGLDFSAGSDNFNAIAESIKNKVPMKDIMSNYSARGDRATAFATAIGDDMRAATGIDVASQIRPNDYANIFSQSERRVAAGLTPENIGAAAAKGSRLKTAGVLNNQIQAGDRLVETLDASLEEGGGKKYKNIPGPIAQDLAADYVKILMGSGQMSEGEIKNAQQATAKGKAAEWFNYWTGSTQTVGSQEFLALLHRRSRQLTSKIRNQYKNQVRTTEEEVPPEKLGDMTGAPEIPELTTRAEVAKLKSGTEFIYNGVRHTKK